MEHAMKICTVLTLWKKTLLVNRFGLSIYYAKPNKEGFNEMAIALCDVQHHPGYHDGRGDLHEANRFEMQRRRTFRPYSPSSLRITCSRSK